MNPIRVSLIGHGHLGKWHAQKIKTHENVKFIGIADKFFKESSLEHLYPELVMTGSYEELIEMSDAFIVVTPTNTHFEICKNLIQHGKHVFCEKPVATNAQESRELMELVKKHDVKFFVGHSERCHQAWELLDFKLADSIVLQRFTMPKERAYDVSVVEDLMVHDIDLFYYLFNLSIDKLKARGKVHHTGLLDEVTVEIKTKCRKIVTIESNRNCAKEKRSLSCILGSEKVEVDLMNLEIRKNDEIITLEKRDHLLIEQHSFYNDILSNTGSLTTIEDGHKAMKVIDAIHLSIDENREVSF